MSHWENFAQNGKIASSGWIEIEIERETRSEHSFRKMYIVPTDTHPKLTMK